MPHLAAQVIPALMEPWDLLEEQFTELRGKVRVEASLLAEGRKKANIAAWRKCLGEAASCGTK